MLVGAPVLANSTSTINELVGAYIKSLDAPIAGTKDGSIVNCMSDPANPLCVRNPVADAVGAAAAGSSAFAVRGAVLAGFAAVVAGAFAL